MDTIAEQGIYVTNSSIDEYLQYMLHEKTKSKVLTTDESNYKEKKLIIFKNNIDLIERNVKQKRKVEVDLTYATVYQKKRLPEYFEENLIKLNLFYENILSNNDDDSRYLKMENIQEIKDNLYQSIAEINFIDFNIEITKSNLLKTTLLIDNDRLLIISKNIDEEFLNDNDIVYSYFVNKELIASDVENIKIFTEKFVDYLSL
jgi:hypothetical protein